MSWRELTGPWGKKLREALKNYKYVLLVILTGALLLSLPALGKEDGNKTASAANDSAAEFDLTDMEKKVADALSQISGAGKVTVVLTVKAGTRQILAQDSKSSLKDGDDQMENTTVVVNKGSGYQEAVAVQAIYPQFQGALVVCTGGGDPAVKLKLVEAVSALTGLGSDKISICKGK